MGFNVEVPEDVTRDATRFLQRVLGPAADFSDLLGDQIRFFRWRNAAKILARAETTAEELGLGKLEVPLKYILPFIEKASLEEDEELQKLWANLLVDQCGQRESRLPLFSSILSEITHHDALILRELHAESDRMEDMNFYNLNLNEDLDSAMALPNLGVTPKLEHVVESFRKERITVWIVTANDVPNTNEFHFGDSDLQISLMNLSRLRLVEFKNKSTICIDEINSSPHGMRVFLTAARINIFGHAFMNACLGETV